jgi:hypothetical protein
MRGPALIVFALAVAGCNHNPPLPDPPKIVRVPVKEFVAVPAELSKPCAEIEKKSNTYGEAIRLANQRLLSLQECNKRLAEIRKLGENP